MMTGKVDGNRFRSGKLQGCRNFGPLLSIKEMNSRIADLKSESEKEQKDVRAA